MLTRTLSGAVYVIILVGFFLLRSISPLFFNGLIWFFAIMSAFEMGRALKDYSVKGGLYLAIVFAALFVPVYTITEYFLSGYGFAFALGFTAAYLLFSAVYALAVKGGIKKYAVTTLSIIYPALLLLTMLIVNDFYGDKSLIALILIFVISPCSDVMAYLTGMTWNKIRKGNAKKLCPNLSPKKTWAGAIGGVVGGALGGLIVYFIFKGQAEAFSTVIPAVVYFILVGLIGSVFTEVGDLFESGIKRKVGIKDMGKIMPGHGGVLDRIDGTVFCSAFILIAFLFI
ncbi:MAG: CDP-archaeol synthase [Clostridia bacterium]|nr:CDP-archaeol synthase [Clostridia bacterium]